MEINFNIKNFNPDSHSIINVFKCNKAKGIYFSVGEYYPVVEVINNELRPIYYGVLDDYLDVRRPYCSACSQSDILTNTILSYYEFEDVCFERLDETTVKIKNLSTVDLI